MPAKTETFQGRVGDIVEPKTSVSPFRVMLERDGEEPVPCAVFGDGDRMEMLRSAKTFGLEVEVSGSWKQQSGFRTFHVTDVSPANGEDQTQAAGGEELPAPNPAGSPQSDASSPGDAAPQSGPAVEGTGEDSPGEDDTPREPTADPSGQDVGRSAAEQPQAAPGKPADSGSAPASPGVGIAQIARQKLGIEKSAELAELVEYATVFHQSGFFKGVQSISQGVVQILTGRDLGVPPMVALREIHIIEGRPSLSAALMAGLIKRSGRYRYRVDTHNDTECTLEFFERLDRSWESVGYSTFTIDDAATAGLIKDRGNWKKYPKAMLFARALSAGARMFCADVFGGTVYVPGEIPGDPREEEPAEDAGEHADVVDVEIVE